MGGPVSIEWPVEVMCCAHLTIFAFVDVIYILRWQRSWVSQRTNQMNLWVDQSIYRSPRSGDLLFYTLEVPWATICFVLLGAETEIFVEN